MSEQQETPAEVPPVQKQRSNKQASGSSGAFLAMVIALAAGGGSYYVWQQHLTAEQDRQALRKSVEQLLTAVEERDRAQQARIEQLRDHHHATLEQRLGALEQSLPDLAQQLSLQQREWNIAEVDYLLRLAEQRLQLSRDIPTAIAALRQAQEQLLNYTNGNFAEVVAQIGDTIDSLLQLEQHNVTQVTTRLGGLLTAVDTLPLALQGGQPLAQEEPPQPPAADAGLSTRAAYWGHMVWHDIKSLVTIRRSDELTPALMNDERRELIQAQLRLKLEVARLGAAGHQQPLFETGLREAAELLERYFDDADNAVSATQATLRELATFSLNPELPSLQGLRQQLSAAQLTGAAPLEAPAQGQMRYEPPSAAPFPSPALPPQPEVVEGVDAEQQP